MGERVRILWSTFQSYLHVGERPPAYFSMSYAVDQLTEPPSGLYRIVVHHLDGRSEAWVGHKARRNVLGRDCDTYDVSWAPLSHPQDGSEIEIIGPTWGSWEALARNIACSAPKLSGGESYREAYASIAPLASYIADGPLAEALRGFTSMHALCIHQSGSPQHAGPLLRVSPLESGLVEFRYVDTQVKERQWHRIEPPDQLIARFDHFVEQLHWLIKERTIVE